MGHEKTPGHTRNIPRSFRKMSIGKRVVTSTRSYDQSFCSKDYFPNIKNTHRQEQAFSKVAKMTVERPTLHIRVPSSC